MTYATILTRIENYCSARSGTFSQILSHIRTLLLVFVWGAHTRDNNTCAVVFIKTIGGSLSRGGRICEIIR